MQEPFRSSTTYEIPRWRDKIWRWLGLVAGGAVALVIALSLLQCSLKKPEAPTWDTTLRIPVTADRLDIANILLRLDNGDRFVDDLGNVGLFIADTLDTVTTGASLALPSQWVQVPEALGQVSVGAPPGDTVRSDLVEYYGGPPGTIPPFDVFDVDTLGPFPQYTWMAPDAGEAWIRNKGLTLDARSPEDYVRILDRLPLAPASPTSE